jgi:hypothetical protein
MTRDELRSVILASPFRPFRLRFSSGAHLDVPHPEFIAMSPGGRTAVVFTAPGSWETGSPFCIVDLLLVESVEFPRRRNGGGRNGSRRRH